jgi:hypothetical protein
VVQETALAGLESPEDGDVESPLFREEPATADELIERCDAMAAADALDLGEHVCRDLLITPGFFSLSHDFMAVSTSSR